MRVMFTGDGTGSHIYPILAIIERLKETGISNDDKILFVGTERGLESKIVPRAGINFKTTETQGSSRKNLAKDIETIELFMKITKKVRKTTFEFKPDVVLDIGGYVSSAIVHEVAKMGTPTPIYESNSVIGLVNKFLGHYADKICHAFNDTAKQFSEKKKLIQTGNPRS